MTLYVFWPFFLLFLCREDDLEETINELAFFVWGICTRLSRVSFDIPASPSLSRTHIGFVILSVVWAPPTTQNDGDWFFFLSHCVSFGFSSSRVAPAAGTDKRS